jgi:uncharacterized protein (TIGR03067 family)
MGESVTLILPTLLFVSSLHQAAAHKQMEGAWEVVSETWAGWRLPDDLRAQEVTVKGNVFTHVGKERSEPSSLRFRPFNLPPALDLVDADGEGHFAAIYKFDKDTLTICYVIRRSLDRPAEFTSTKDDTNALLVLKRKKAP